MNNNVKVIKTKNGVATVIEYNGQRYILQHENQFKRT
jgi:hypothetical protein